MTRGREATGILALIAEIKKCEDADATLAVIALCYICIDAMAYAAMPAGRPKNTGADFKSWVDRYLKAAQQQPYQYRGEDVWAARCSYLHTFSASADYHANHDVVTLTYHDGTDHYYDQKIDAKLAVLGLKSFSDDITRAIYDFLAEANADEAKRSLVLERLGSFFSCYPLR